MPRLRVPKNCVGELHTGEFRAGKGRYEATYDFVLRTRWIDQSRDFNTELKQSINWAVYTVEEVRDGEPQDVFFGWAFNQPDLGTVRELVLRYYLEPKIRIVKDNGSESYLKDVRTLTGAPEVEQPKVQAPPAPTDDVFQRLEDILNRIDSRVEALDNRMEALDTKVEEMRAIIKSAAQVHRAPENEDLARVYQAVRVPEPEPVPEPVPDPFDIF